jgi:NADH-quinone oxidoreductase subunit H
MFFLGEYVGIFAMSAVAATLFLGGYHLPGLDSDLLGPLVLIGKSMLLVFLIIWFRWTWPRVREDQLQGFAWRWLVPLALANIAVTATLKVAL